MEATVREPVEPLAISGEMDADPDCLGHRAVEVPKRTENLHYDWYSKRGHFKPIA
jgi:hypothetical protein